MASPAVAMKIGFVKGGQFFTILANYIGRQKAYMALEMCASVCSYNVADCQSRIAALAMSPYVNPRSSEAIASAIEVMGLELLMTMIESKCLMPGDTYLKWDLFEIMPGALVMKPRYGVPSLTHPLVDPALLKPHFGVDALTPSA